jgi:type II secretory pathway predicted ATPase ExeA/cell division septation protein DedD
MSKYFENEKICSDPASRTEDSQESSSRLYLEFYNLRESPFSIPPDPEFLYMSSSHKMVLEKILYGIHSRMGFLLLIGEVGSGKTTLCRTILDELKEKAETVYIINPSLSGTDLIQSILDDLGINYPTDSSKKELLHQLNNFLISASKERPIVIIIDDAQTMTVEGLETLRLLSNLETDKEKLLQLVLAGQQELLDILSKPELRQLQQRIAIRCRLDLLQKSETQGYISHRLFVAGDKGNIRFSPAGINKIYKASSGIPRLINKICDYALTSGYVSNSHIIDKIHINQALDEIAGNLQEKSHRFRFLLSGATKKRIWLELSILGVIILGLGFLRFIVFADMGTAENNKMSVLPTLTTAAPSTSAIKENTIQDANNAVVKPPEKPGASSGTQPIPAENPEIQAEQTTGCFILQMASFTNKSNALRAVSHYSEKAFPIHWNPVDIGDAVLWYRVYAGTFPTKEGAKKFQAENGLAEGIIINAPWTILAADSADKDELLAKVHELHNKGYDCILAGDADTGYRITIGAFLSSEGAAKMAQEIANEGFNARVIHQ